MIKNGYYGNEGLGLAWDCIEVFQVALFITTIRTQIPEAGRACSLFLHYILTSDYQEALYEIVILHKWLKFLKIPVKVFFLFSKITTWRLLYTFLHKYRIALTHSILLQCTHFCRIPLSECFYFSKLIYFKIKGSQYCQYLKQIKECLDSQIK